MLLVLVPVSGKKASPAAHCRILECGALLPAGRDAGARSHPRERLVPAVENTPGDMWGKWGVAYGKIGSVMQWLVSVSYRFTRPALVSNVDGIQLGKKYKEAGRSSGATR